jgi:hypothetical protein
LQNRERTHDKSLINYRPIGRLSTCSGNPRLGEHCDFTKEELDFIIDYVLERKFESADRRLLRTSILTKIEEPDRFR